MGFTEDLMLPSRGIIYRNKDFDGMVKVKAFTTKNYKDLLASNVSDTGVRQFVDCCLVDCPVKAKNMHQEDLLAILFKTRIMTLGNTLKTQVKCQQCGHIENIEWDLNDVNINYLYAEEYPLPVKLPCGTDIRVRFPTGGDSYKAKAEAQKRAKMFDKQESEFLPIYNTVVLVDYDGKDIIEKAAWYESLSPRDAIYIDEVLSELNGVFGVDLTHDVRCAECDNTFKTYIDISSDFFRPDRHISFGITSKTGNLAGIDKKSDISEQES